MEEVKVGIAFNAENGVYTISTRNEELAKRIVSEVFFDNKVLSVNDVVSAENAAPKQKRKWTRKTTVQPTEQPTESGDEKKSLAAQTATD